MPHRDRDARERLRDSALKLFGEKGYAETSVRAIAHKARCNLALIKHYYGSKEGLLREILALGLAPIHREIASLQALQASPEERLRRFIDFMVDHFDRNRMLLQIVYREIIQTPHSIVSDLRPAVQGNAALMVGVLEEARARGILAPVDPRIAGLMLMGMIQSYFLNYSLASTILGPRTDELLTNLKQHIARVFLHGVMTTGKEMQT